MYSVDLSIICSGVVLLWAGGARAPRIFGSDYSKSRVWAPKYLRQKGPKMILEAWAPQCQIHDYTSATLKYLINEYTRLDILAFFLKILNYFHHIFLIPMVEK